MGHAVHIHFIDLSSDSNIFGYETHSLIIIIGDVDNNFAVVCIKLNVSTLTQYSQLNWACKIHCTSSHFFPLSTNCAKSGKNEVKRNQKAAISLRVDSRIIFELRSCYARDEIRQKYVYCVSCPSVRLFFIYSHRNWINYHYFESMSLDDVPRYLLVYITKWKLISISIDLQFSMVIDLCFEKNYISVEKKKISPLFKWLLISFFFLFCFYHEKS